MKVEAQGQFVYTSFGARFRRLRIALGNKQSSMSAAGLRCTDAAISHWERGKRLPSVRMMRRVLKTFLELGAPPIDVDGLRTAWTTERGARSGERLPLLDGRPDAATPI
jgi:transcriptional regulator with XRE-family HTH domain